MIFLTVKRQKALEEVIRYAITAGAFHHDQILLERDQSDDHRIRTIHGFVEQEFAFYFYREPWWRRIFRRKRIKKCEPIPCPPFEQVSLTVE